MCYVSPWSLLECYRRFRVTGSVHHHEIVSETLLVSHGYVCYDSTRLNGGTS